MYAIYFPSDDSRKPYTGILVAVLVKAIASPPEVLIAYSWLLPPGLCLSDRNTIVSEPSHAGERSQNRPDVKALDGAPSNEIQIAEVGCPHSAD